jgi:hypothetical protein
MRNYVLYVLLGLVIWSIRHQSIAQSLQERQTTASNIRMTVNNLGMIGNSFKGSFDDPALRYSSCEYPAGSNIEHLFQGALWVGAKVKDRVLVTTGAIDNPAGYSVGQQDFEFTTEPFAPIVERSSRLDNPSLYRVDAISHQDFVADFTDKNIIVPGTNRPIARHEPLFADVHFESYNWNFSFANYFVILNYTITNNSPNAWEDVFLGYYADPTIRNVNQTPAGSGGSNFFNKGGSGYIDTMYCAYEFDAIGDVGFTDSYFGFKYLGSDFNGQFKHPQVDTNFKVNYNTWTFRATTGADIQPNSDNDRYLRLSQGMNNNPARPDWETAIRPGLQRPGNRGLLLSAGPYARIEPGQSVNVAFAVVCAKKSGNAPAREDTPQQRSELIKNSVWAQSAYNGEDRNFNGVLDPGEDKDGDNKLDRYLLPSPPPTIIDTVITENNSIKIYWANDAEAFIDPISKRQDFEGYRIWTTKTGFDIVGETQDLLASMEPIAQFDRKEFGGIRQNSPSDLGTLTEFNNGFEAIRLKEPVRFPNNPNTYHYMYEVKNVLNGWQYGLSVTAFDHGDTTINLGPLETNPLSRVKRTFPGTKANPNFSEGDPFVYPNPYYGGAAWERAGTAQEDRRIVFANLPARAAVRVYTTAGDLVYNFTHNGADDGTSTRWYATNARVDGQQKRVFSGGEHAWNLISNDKNIIARGIYIYTVEDLDNDTIKRGKFVVIK